MMEEKIDITATLRMASLAACDPRHRQTLLDAIEEINTLREALEKVKVRSSHLMKESGGTGTLMAKSIYNQQMDSINSIAEQALEGGDE